MTEALNRVFAEIATFTTTMADLHHDFLSLVQRDIERFLDQTKSLTHQMHWHGWTTLGLTSLSASLAIAGALIPKGGPANTPAPDSRLGANGGIPDALKAITDKLSDNDFLRTTCKTTSKFFNDGVTPAANVWHSSTTTDKQSKLTLLERINLQDGQSKKSDVDQKVQQAQQAALRLSEIKSRGG
jgi:hypothetical protein